MRIELFFNQLLRYEKRIYGLSVILYILYVLFYRINDLSKSLSGMFGGIVRIGKADLKPGYIKETTFARAIQSEIAETEIINV